MFEDVNAWCPRDTVGVLHRQFGRGQSTFKMCMYTLLQPMSPHAVQVVHAHVNVAM